MFSRLVLLVALLAGPSAAQINTQTVVSSVTSQLQPLVTAAVRRALAASRTSEITSSVVTALQPSIAAAVAQALSASQRAAAPVRGLTEEEEAEYNRRLVSDPLQACIDQPFISVGQRAVRVPVQGCGRRGPGLHGSLRDQKRSECGGKLQLC